MIAIDVETLLAWAYRDELCKGGEVTAGVGFFTLAELGTLVDGDQFGSTARLPPIFGEPHPDAIAIDRAVRALPDIEIDWERSGAAFIGEPAKHMPDPLARYALRPSVLLIMHGKMGSRPQWRTDPMRVRGIRVQGGGCRIVGTVSGGRKGRLWYSDGAHCPLELMPSWAEVAYARAEYWAWWHGLDELVRQLDGALVEHGAVPAGAPQFPWWS
jgi:hypothetical protein